MPSVFTRKSKTKPTGDLQVIQTTGQTEQLQSPTEPPPSLNGTKCPLKPSLTYSSTLNRIALRASSASPQPNSLGRRITGVSVTFESTLPTQVWQASPSPSPPPLSPTALLRDNRMVASVSDDWSLRESSLDNVKPPRVTPKQSNFGSASIQNWLPQEEDTDDSSDETSPSGLTHKSFSSTCSSSDESVTGKESKVRHKNSSSGTTPTTDSSSSLDMRVVHSTEDTSTSGNKLRRRSHGSRHQCSEKRGHRKSEDKKRRLGAMITQTLGASSSSSSSSEDDLEALGWDEKTISAAITNRNGRNRKAGLPNLNSNLTGKPNSKKLLPVNTKTSKKNDSLPGFKFAVVDSQIQAQALHTQSCLLLRRHNQPGMAGPVNYASPTALRSGNRKLQPVHADSKRNLTSELLAVITNDYKPLPEWEQEYKVLPVRKGEYVCVLSQPMHSRSTAGMDGTPCKQDRSQDTSDSNTWLYVRRWCADHLVATGPPGFVPRHHCRLLPSKEILSLWQQSQFSRNNIRQQPISTADNKPTPTGLVSTTSAIADFTISLARMQISEQSEPGSMVVQQPSGYPFIRSSLKLDTFHPTSTKLPHSQVPPPPIGFGSGCSFGGSETEDRDSGRGPSSGSEWSSGRGGSSNVTLDNTAVMDKRSVDISRFQRRTDPQSGTDRGRNTNSAEESQLGWYAHDGSVFSSGHSSNREEEVYSHETAETSSTERLTFVQLPISCQSAFGKQSTSVGQTSTITLTTCTSYTPVLELRPGGTPTLHARGISTTGADSLVASTTTCTTVVDISRPETLDTEAATTKDKTSPPNPALWEPYKTVIHVNENSMEKFTLV